MTAPPGDSVHRDALEAVVRRVVAIGIAIGVPAMTASAVLLWDTDPVVRWGYPPLLGYLAVYAWVLVRRPAEAVRFSQVTLVLFDVAWLVAMAVRLRTGDDAATAWTGLFPTVHMGFVVFLVIGFAFGRPRSAVVHGGALTLAVVVVGVLALAGRDGTEAVLRDLLRYGVFLVVITMGLHAIARARTHLAVAEAAARQADAIAVRMRDMAYLDPLTGLANRRRVVEELGHQAELVGPDRPTAVLYFDLDHFKAVNDELGHATGDRVLCVVADVASRVVRQDDVVGRLGGEEFLVIAPGTDHARAVQLAERLRQLLPEELRVAVGVAVTASFGVVSLRPGEAPAAVLDRVDTLMYAAKGAGRDRVTALTSG